MADRRTVLLVAQQLAATRSGLGLYVRTLLRELSRRGRDVACATWTDEIDADSFPNVPFVDLGPRPTWDRTPGGFVALGTRLADVLRDTPERFALLHFTDAREAFGCLSRGRGAVTTRSVGTVHDDYAARAPLSPFSYVGRAADPFVRWAYYRWLAGIERRAYASLARIMVNSEATGATVAARYGMHRESLRTVHLCVEPRPVSTARAKLDGEPSVLFAGGNFYRKGLDTLVSALPIARESAPDIHVHVAGQDRAAARVQRLASRLGVASSISFHGRVDRETMAAAFAAADVFAMPSRTEALGLVYLEAMRADVPVISGNVGGVTEIVRDGVSGVTVTPEDPAALAAAILRVHTDADLRRRLVEGGRVVLAERTPERLADETEAVYDDALDG